MVFKTISLPDYVTIAYWRSRQDSNLDGTSPLGLEPSSLPFGHDCAIGAQDRIRTCVEAYAE